VESRDSFSKYPPRHLKLRDVDDAPTYLYLQVKMIYICLQGSTPYWSLFNLARAVFSRTEEILNVECADASLTHFHNNSEPLSLEIFALINNPQSNLGQKWIKDSLAFVILLKNHMASGEFYLIKWKRMKIIYDSV
jgi:hypothetical protein